MIQVSEEFLRHSAMLMRQRDCFDGEERAEANKVWSEIMQEVRGRIALGLDELTVEDFDLTPQDKPWLDHVLERLRSMLRKGEL